jgi:hypothetical protein
MSRLILGDLNQSQQSNRLDLAVLEVSISKVGLGNDYTIKLKHYSSLSTEHLVSEAVGQIKWFENFSDGLSCYYTTAVNLLGISNKKIDLGQLADFTSTRILELIICNDDLKAVWDEFLKNAKSSELGVVVGVDMASYLTFPLEHLKFAVVEDVELLIVKTSSIRFDVSNLYDNLPKRIVVILGQDYTGEDKLNFDLELKNIYCLLGRPDDYDYSLIMYSGATIDYIKSGVKYTVDILPPRCRPDNIEEEICKLREPYLLIYSGHGIDLGINQPSIYPRGYIDGELGIYGNERTKTLCHADFAKILSKNPPCGVILNCCSAIRGFSFKDKNNDNVDGPEGLNSFEGSYYKLFGKIKFIIAHRTKICSISAALKTISATESLIKDKSMLEMMVNMTKEQYNCELQSPSDYEDKIVRDHISEVFWVC